MAQKFEPVGCSGRRAAPERRRVCPPDVAGDYQSKRLTMLCRIIGWAALLVVTMVSLVPGDLRPHLFPSGQLEHFVAYGLAGFVIGLGCRRRSILLAIGVLLPLYAAALEFAQVWSPRRDPKRFDIAAGTLGCLLSVASLHLLRRT